jgi:PKD repeat protein
VLTFKSWYQTENTGPDKDYKKMFISTDGGANWTQVCQVSGTMDTWVDYSVNISVYAGKSANIKFEFNTTDHLLNNYEGWYIDDLKINVRPTARFTCVPSNPTTADTIQFIDTSRDSDGTIVSYLWDFGDGNTSSEQTPIYRYTAPGTYIVNQTVTDDDDAIDSMLKTVVIVVNEPLPMEGDVNGNGHVTSVDSQLLQDYLVDPAAHPLNDSQLTSANTYEIAPDPSTINIYDVMYIQKWLSDPSTPLWDEEHDLEVTVPPQP